MTGHDRLGLVTFELLVGESLPDGLRRMAEEELDAALASLESAPDDPVEAIHSARKRCKQVRTVLRLARGGALADAEYRRESLVVRNAARLIGGVRDAQVAVETLEALRRDLPAPSPDLDADLEGLGERLDRRQEALVEAALGKERRVATAICQLRLARSRVRRWPLDGDGFATIGPGLARLHRQGRQRLAKVEREPTTEHFHELRKRVKDLWYAMRILRPVWPGPQDAVIEEWHRLSDVLGTEHDLAATLDLAAAELPEELSSVESAIGARRSELQAEAVALARRLFVDRPRDFTRHLEACWTLWRSGPGAAAEEGESA